MHFAGQFLAAPSCHRASKFATANLLR